MFVYCLSSSTIYSSGFMFHYWVGLQGVWKQAYPDGVRDSAPTPYVRPGCHLTLLKCINKWGGTHTYTHTHSQLDNCYTRWMVNHPVLN